MRIWTLALAFSLCVLWDCSSPKQAGEACEKDTQCASPLICQNQQCTQPKNKEPSQEPTAKESVQDAAPQEQTGTCPAACLVDGDCEVCGDYYCAGGACIPRPKACPESCSSDQDCPANACGARTACIGKRCKVACPSSCTKDEECQVSGCGEKVRCDNGTCSPPPQGETCPTSCVKHEDCPATKCGAKNQCIGNVCKEPLVGCPEVCFTDDDCEVPACANKVICSAGACRAQDALTCPQSCQSDLDCMTIPDCCPRTMCVGNVCKDTGCPCTCNTDVDCQIQGCKQKKMHTRCVSLRPECFSNTRSPTNERDNLPTSRSPYTRTNGATLT